MSGPSGGTRARLVHDSLFHLIQDSLTALGWLDVRRAHQPVTFRATPIAMDEEVPLNTIAFEPGISTDTSLELGTTATVDDWPFYIDVYAEDRSLGLGLSGDIRDILRGKLPAIGRNHATLPVYDYSVNPATLLFAADIINVKVDLAHGWPHPWRQNWFSIECTVQDEG